MIRTNNYLLRIAQLLQNSLTIRKIRFFHSGGLNSAIDNAISIVYNTSIPRIGLLDDTVRANIRNVVLDLKEKNPGMTLCFI